MIRYVQFLGGLLLAGTLAACGGGGGSAGTTQGGAGGAGTGGTGGTGGAGTTTAPSITLTLADASGAAVSGNAVTTGSTVFAKATVRNAAGVAQPSKLVTFTAAGGVIAFQPASGQVLTDASGVATVQVAPSSASSAGADTLTASATVDGLATSASLDVQTSAANVTLANLTAAQTNLTAYQNTAVTVDVAVNGAAATTTPVTVGFSSTCGTFSPSSSTSNSVGKASATFQATGCTGGVATLTASAAGAAPVQTSVTVQTPTATNLLFVAASPTTIYTAGASSGVKQSTVQFRVVDAGGNPIASQSVRISLAPSAIAAGVVYADTGATTPQIVSTDALGVVSVIVKSGPFPTPLSLTAELVSNPSISASSSGLSVDSGRAVQNFLSLSASVFNIEGARYDGEITTLTVRAADRLGQPVPAGTPVSFITEGGQITASCTLAIDANNKSGCFVSLQSQNFRPSNGRVTVLAYMDGDEIFVDTNGNNRYDAGETFFDMGQPFLDANEDNVYDSVSEQKVGDPSVPGSGIGSSACPAHANQIANVPNTCDGAWGAVRVRAQGQIVFSDSFAQQTGVFSQTNANGTTVFVRDLNNNPLPFGTSVTATISGGTNCSVVEVIGATVGSTTSPTSHRVVTTRGNAAGDTCSGAVVTVKTTTPKGNVTPLGSVTLP